MNNTNQPYVDLRKLPVEIGDTIAAALTLGRSADLRIGKIVEFPEPKREGARRKIRVQWLTDSYGFTPEASLIEANSGRYAKVDLPPAP